MFRSKGWTLNITSEHQTRQLNVFINASHIGVLHENNGVWQFCYDAGWLALPQSFPLAPYLPLQSEPHTDNGSYRPVQWLFDNLLPEEQARALLASSVKVAVEDAFGLLEAIGGESAGAMTLLTPETELPQGSQALISDDDLSQRIQSLPRSPMNRGDRKRMSLAGAQHKMLIIQQDDLLLMLREIQYLALHPHTEQLL